MTESSRILLVDDEAMNIQSLNAILESDYRTFFATSGEQALAMARDELPDLILLDVMMPGMDGYEVCRQLKHDGAAAKIPVIFITGRDSEESEEQGLRAGAVDYIQKPISAPVVKARVDNHILLKRYRDQFETLSMEDPLTGIANRRRFDGRLVEEWRRARRNGSPVSLLALDVDAFKAFNDHEGHGAGDDCLRSIAATLGASVQRPADLACRVGGEEFSCLLPETDTDGALTVAERIRGAVEALAIAHPRSPVGDVVTASIGTATLTPGGEDDPERLTVSADRALYEAKQAGRNRVVQAPSSL